MQSPTEEGAQKFNWARVLKHEFIHVINLQQTNFNIPHWYTEALATLNEGYPRPASWNQLLAARVSAGKAFNLDTINLGFIRPHSSDDWSMAYCQAELYAEYMLERFGEGSLAKLLAAYAANLTTREAIPQAFSIEVADFEKGYQEYLSKIVKSIGISSQPQELTVAQLEAKLEGDTDNLDLQAQLALAHLNRRRYPDAGQFAKGVLVKNPKHQLAAYVQARLQMIVGENEAALKLLEESLDEAAPQPNLLGLLAGIRLKAEDYGEAARLYELGAKHSPGDDKWIKSLAQVYLKTKDNENLTKVLEQLVAVDFEEYSTRKKLAQLYLEAKNFEQAARYATEGIQIDVMDTDLHRTLAEASTQLGRHHEAVFEYETLALLDSSDVTIKLSLAKACVQAGRNADAKKALDEVLKTEPDNKEARELMEKHSL
jgi:cellulose synthase operon protein C